MFARNRNQIITAMRNMDSVTTAGVTQNRTVNSENQITAIGGASLTYDNNGNTTTDDQGDTLVYDAWNRLVAVKDGSGNILKAYEYDGLGRLISETDGYTTTDLYYSGTQVIEERTGAAGIP